MRSTLLAFLAAFLSLTGLAHAVGPNNALNEPATHPRQDASQGRDAAAVAGTLVKVGGGAKGFDFTKIANNGSVLPANAALGTGASAWGCTYDNVTGLLWEVKVNDPIHLRHMNHTYTWYNSNSAINGGAPGLPSGGTCQTAGRCDTEKYAADVSAAGMCGHSDWRMPTSKELESLLDQGVAYLGTTIETTYFPNTVASDFWSGSPTADISSGAWGVYFYGGYTYSTDKSDAFSVRLVRAGQ
ncbi:MAG: DUF1566 domain-containing protein [Acidobacteriota bacterium]